MKMLLTKKFTFEMAHALDGYDGKCANLHGHSYHMEVTMEGPANVEDSDGDGIIIDFHAIKDIVQQAIIDRFDHALVLKDGSSLIAASTSMSNLINVPFNPTTENLLLHFAKLIEPHLPTGTRLYSIKLAETDTSVAELLM